MVNFISFLKRSQKAFFRNFKMAVAFLQKEGVRFSDLKNNYAEFEELYNQKLWHQLTIALSNFVLKKSNWKNNENNLVSLYECFIVTFKDKLNTLKLVQIASVIVQQYVANKQLNEAVEFIKGLVDNEMDPASLIVIKMSLAELHLMNKNQEECEELIQSVKKRSLPLVYGTGQQGVAYSSFYRVTTAFYKLAGPAEKFYDNTIQFLAYTSLDSLDEHKKIGLAKDICFAALIGTDVFNFGEIIPQPILKVLEETEDAWLLRLLESFHDGDIINFAKIFETHEKMFQEYKILSSNIDILRQKIGIMCLLKMIFERGSEQRTLDIDEIARTVKIDSKMAEWLLMRAMAKGLVKGKIDGVKRTVNITWLKPRVLTKDQLGTMEDKLGVWKKKVINTSEVLLEETAELNA